MRRSAYGAGQFWRVPKGGLEWRVVGPALYRHPQRLDIAVELFAPQRVVGYLGEKYTSAFAPTQRT